MLFNYCFKKYVITKQLFVPLFESSKAFYESFFIMLKWVDVFAKRKWLVNSGTFLEL